MILKAWGSHADREIGEVRDDNPEASVQYFEERFSDLENKINELEKTIEESVNKGSFLMKLLHLQKVIQIHEGIGDYQALLDRVTSLEAVLQGFVSKNRERNTEIKKALIDEAKIAVEKINWKEATEEVHDIKNRWIKTGNAVEGEQEKLETTFWETLGRFFDMKKAFYEDKKRLSVKTKESYEALVTEAKAMNNMHGKERFEKVKLLKQQWADLGSILKEDYAPLIDEFNKALKPYQKNTPDIKIDLRRIVTELDACLSGEQRTDLKKLEGYRAKLKGYRPNEYQAKQDRKDIFTKIQLLKEISFLKSIASKRNKAYNTMEVAEKKQLEIKILQELLSRDHEDLKLYTENSEKFSSASGGMNPMIEKKLNQQKTKVVMKENLLEMLKKGVI